MSIFDGLNDRQKEAVEHIEGPCLVLAGAGSGKTKVLTTRIAHLIEKGVYSSNILAITFTNKAAKEMKERLENLVGENYAFVGTFHSFGLRIIKENYELLGLTRNFTIIDSDDVTTVIRKILKELGYDPKEYSPGFIKSKISFIKNEMLTPSEVEKFLVSPIEKVAAKVYFEYEKSLKKNNAVDFDDLLKLPVELFKSHADILDKYQEKYHYILVDEYQDTNEVQYKLVRTLAEKYRNLFVVGDANQCLSKDTLITTKDGIKQISDIKVGDMILSGVGKGQADYEKVEHVFSRDYEGKILTIETELGKKIKLTPDHTCFYLTDDKKSNCNNRLTINYLGQEPKFENNNCLHRLVFCSTDEESNLILKNAGFNLKRRNNLYRLGKKRSSANDLEQIKENIIKLIPNTVINEKIYLENKRGYSFIKAGLLKRRMIIPVLHNGVIVEDKIIKITSEEVKEKVYDLSIPTTRNIVANDVCVHNCIYAFRGSNYKNILNFEKDYPDAKVVVLNQNYRSTTTILDAANAVIKNNSERKEVDLFSELGKGLKIKYMRSYDEKHEVTLILEEINKLLDQGYNYKDIAILYRTNGQARAIEDGMLKNNYPYKVVGSYYFYKRKEIKDLLSYLRLISNHDDEVSLRRVINEPKRGIGEKSVNDLSVEATIQGISMFDAITKPKEMEFKKLILELTEDAKNCNLTELIDKVLEKSGIKSELERDQSLESELRMENLMEFKSITENYQKETGVVNLEDFLDEISIVSDIAEHKDIDNAITLMTIHSAKGLEFNTVFLAGMEENIMPHSMSLQEENGIEEERRLCYVAITRAKERLYLTNAKKRMLFGNTTMNAPSRFITEIDESLIDKDDRVKQMESREQKFNKSLFYSDENKLYNHGDIVYHNSFGRGVVVESDEKFVTVAFNNRVGIKKFLSNYQGLKKE